jgi:hypothetical protein
MKTHHNFNRLIALSGALLLSGLLLARAEENKVQLMFVQTADDLKADANTLRLVNVGQQTLYFSDRPVRVAGHLTMPAYMDEWKAGEGPDNFSSDPPTPRYRFMSRGATKTRLPWSRSVIRSLMGRTWSTATS